MPKSVFQIGGAGTVGTGSLRGMPLLRDLRRAGFSVFPFEEARPPCALEIYPRYLTGRVNKSSAVARTLYLEKHFPELPWWAWRLAGKSEDAFDACVSALRMWQHRTELTHLPRARTHGEALEGRIWSPLRDPFYPL